jgi:hypothetical protein
MSYPYCKLHLLQVGPSNCCRILYSHSVVQLLRPLLGIEGLSSAGIKQVIWTHAQTGLFLLDQYYCVKYTCRYQPVFQMFAAFHLCDTIAQFFPRKIDAITNAGPQAVHFGIEVLTQSYRGVPVAGTFQELLSRTAVDGSISLPSDLNDHPMSHHPPKPIYRTDAIIDACTWRSYLQPIADI